MTSRALRLATALVRAWTRIYTCRLDPSIRDARRAEIESDLWEHANATERSASALEIAARLVLGMPNDMRWSIEQHRASAVPFRRTIVLGAASLAVLSIWWVRTAAPPIATPPTPAAPTVHWLNTKSPPPPPPPPPPLCNPPGRPAFSPCTKWP